MTNDWLFATHFSSLTPKQPAPPRSTAQADIDWKALSSERASSPKIINPVKCNCVTHSQQSLGLLLGWRSQSKMIESISHITFIVKDVKRSADLFRSVFDAEEVYDSSDKNFSVSYEKFFLIGGTWIAIMEGNPISERSYNHIAFKIPESDFEDYKKKVRKSGLEIIEGRNRIEKEARSIYFYDYDNHLFELHTGELSARLSGYRNNLPR